MDFRYNKKNFEIKFDGKLKDDDEIRKGIEIYKTMQTVGWKYLEDFWKVIQADMEDAMANCVNTESGRNLAALHCAVFKGFRQHKHIAEYIVDVTSKEIAQRKEEELSNDGTTNAAEFTGAE